MVQSFVATAEDTILSKLVWYRLGGQSSDQQWNDLRGVRDVQEPAWIRTICGSGHGTWECRTYWISF